MKKIIAGFLAGGLIASLVVLNLPRPITNKDINAEAINAILWVQTSAEYRALCYQAYNTALERVRNAESGD
ncbi:MAG: hypothetical protein IJR85_06045 [Synergistaceae bacterium]|nr:hypothetical protein [Synergistaceae bacterium]